MRYDAEHKARTRDKVLAAAARALREAGPNKLAVAEVMAEAGLTHGGFYAHFPSKDALIDETIGKMFTESRSKAMSELRGQEPPEVLLSNWIDFYLSTEHRDARSWGCPLPFLAADASRLPEAARHRYAQGAARLVERMAALLSDMGHPEPAATASSALAEMIGTLSWARAEPDPEVSTGILINSRQAVRRRLGLEVDQ